ncbi:hypothetical protein ElyMa_004602800 [Elysia marginata]|uniref:Uncharacterized protein n=1 Tax=Elysia marginata TaxID=1093978 RepID=A0AAV4HXT9_9GAST|nr:hypothetical protein ElyMa_004602800 [Elysia marginata]
MGVRKRNSLGPSRVTIDDGKKKEQLVQTYAIILSVSLVVVCICFLLPETRLSALKDSLAVEKSSSVSSRVDVANLDLDTEVKVTKDSQSEMVEMLDNGVSQSGGREEKASKHL